MRGWLAEIRSALQSIRRAFGLLWSISPPRTLLYGAVTLSDALLPALVAWVAKRIVDAVVAGQMDTALAWVGVECGLVALRSVLYHGDDYLKTWLGGRLSIRVNSLIVDKALQMSARHFEDSAFCDQLARAAKEASSRPLHMIMHGFGFVREAVRLVSYIVLLWGFSPWAVLAVLAGTAPQFAVQAWAASVAFAVQQARTLDERRADYLREVLLREAFVKEVKLFALGRYLLSRYLDHQEDFFSQDQRAVRRTLGWTFAMRILATLVFYGLYFWVVRDTVLRLISLGDMTMLMLVVRGSQESFEALLNNAAKVYEGKLFMSNLFEYLALPEDEPWRDIEDRPQPSAAEPPEIRFEEIRFCYPGCEALALDGVSFCVQPGETVALVGPNGAGKTTLIKLLARLYEPSSGRVRVGGRDAGEMAPAELRRRIGIIFQDFVQFHLTAGENIGVGWIPSIGRADEIRAAAEQGDADGFVQKLEQGYDTMLGRYYGGAQLSIGQWQRIALSRAFMRRSDVLVLDEPTAALDAESEARLFGRLDDLKQGRTAILITHRFSTVRFADRIVVLDEGRLVEQGTHAELLAAGGLYARMFRLQARGYAIES
ncbi:MAG: ABC transporter ATP-binding protein [Deltaproteobacteria bacterium]|nr:ABC transporter ATP-binding protein [Deltaproteobacteria bacterium]